MEHWGNFIGYILLVIGGWRLIWRTTIILGLLGANKLTAKGIQAEENKESLKQLTKGIPLAIILTISGAILILIYKK